jgi:ribosomal protein L11 methyltransferase
MAWHQLSVVTDEDTAPEVSDFFSELGAVSVTYSDDQDEPVYEPALDQTQIWSHTKVTALFEWEADAQLIQSLVAAQFSQQALQSWLIETIEDQAWERAWMEYYQPMLFADKLWVCPTGQEVEESGKVCMTLDPGLAFGTGTHPTTALCLEWLASHPVAHLNVIDYGCGSGILAIAALLLGASQAHGVDIDPQAMTASRDNAEKNRVQQHLQCCLAQSFEPFQADVVLANILANPLIELAPALAALVKPGGYLILSGILNEQAEAVQAAYQAYGMIIERVERREDWCRIDARRER